MGKMYETMSPSGPLPEGDRQRERMREFFPFSNVLWPFLSFFPIFTFTLRILSNNGRWIDETKREKIDQEGHSLQMFSLYTSMVYVDWTENNPIKGSDVMVRSRSASNHLCQHLYGSLSRLSIDLIGHLSYFPFPVNLEYTLSHGENNRFSIRDKEVRGTKKRLTSASISLFK